MHASSQFAATPVRYVAALTLIGAAILKWRGGPIEGFGLPAHQLLLTVEIAVGIALALGIWSRIVLRGTAVLFSVFAAYALSLAVRGATSCGCFGAVHINPWITFTFDSVLAPLCYLASRAKSAAGALSRTRWIVAVLTIFICTYFIWEPFRNASDALLQVGQVRGSTVLLQPERWVSKPLSPALGADQIAGLDEGRWIVLFHRGDCELCQSALPRYEQLMMSPAGSPYHFALVHLSASPGATRSVHASVELTLSSRWKWFGQTPIAVLVENGTVIRVRAGADAIDPASLLSAN